MLAEIYLEAARDCIGDHKSVLLDAEVKTLPDVTDDATLGQLMAAIISQLKDIEEDEKHAKQRAARLEGRALMGKPPAHDHLVYHPRRKTRCKDTPENIPFP